MSANPRVTPLGQPILEPGETCHLAQADVSFQMESGGGYPGSGVAYYGKGNVYVTDRRIILVVEPLENFFTFWGLEIPFLQMYGEKLNLPIFGAKSTMGYVKMLGENGPAGVAEWRAVFNSGGAEPFFFVLRRAMEPAQRDPSEFARNLAVAAADFALKNAKKDEKLEGKNSPEEGNSTAYFDPEDPSRIFVVDTQNH